MKKIIKKITVMAVMSLFAATQLQTPQVNVQAADGVATAEKTTAKQPKIYGRSGIVIDAKSGKILYAKKVDDRHYPASITKIVQKLINEEISLLIENVKTFNDVSKTAADVIGNLFVDMLGDVSVKKDEKIKVGSLDTPVVTINKEIVNDCMIKIN